MTKVIAVHTIHRKFEPGGPVIRVRPGAVFDVTGKEYDDLKKLGAVRDASKADAVAAEEAGNVPAVEKPADEPEKKVDPLDHDGDGRKGGSKPGRAKSRRAVDDDDL